MIRQRRALIVALALALVATIVSASTTNSQPSLSFKGRRNRRQRSPFGVKKNDDSSSATRTSYSDIISQRDVVEFNEDGEEEGGNKISPSTAIMSTLRGGGGKQRSTSKRVTVYDPRPVSKTATQMAQVAYYFVLWYLFNIGYNICNKQALNVIDYPWTLATLQMATGIAYFIPLWAFGIRKKPELTGDEIRELVPIALCHTGVHVGAVIALGSGAVSFAHIVRATEPLVTCFMNTVFTGTAFPASVVCTLFPIVGGVAIASVKDLAFTTLTFISAMLSNLSSSARVVLSKKVMTEGNIGKNLDAQNLYAVLTGISTCILVPLTFLLEGTDFFTAFTNVVKSDTSGFTPKSLALLLFASGSTYYAYNEISFLALDCVNPVTHAIGNTIKRVIIIVASVLAFKTPTSTGAMIGCGMAITGTFLYALAMDAWANSSTKSGKRKVAPKGKGSSDSSSAAIIGSAVAIAGTAMGSVAVQNAMESSTSSGAGSGYTPRKRRPEQIDQGKVLPYMVAAASAFFASFG